MLSVKDVQYPSDDIRRAGSRQTSRVAALEDGAKSRSPVALKAIAPDLAADDGFRERFQRESQLAASLDHPNVIPVYDAGEFDGTLYLIMRWIEGADLRTRLTSGPLAPAHAVRLVLPVASALSAAHRRGLVHRDVKPANIMIAPGDEETDEHVYLTDFG